MTSNQFPLVNNENSYFFVSQESHSYSSFINVLYLENVSTYDLTYLHQFTTKANVIILLYLRSRIIAYNCNGENILKLNLN